MLKIFTKIILLFGLVAIIVMVLFIASLFKDPAGSMHVYISSDNLSVWAEGNPLYFQKEISGTQSYKTNLEWSPSKKYVAFYDNTRELLDPDREWFLKVFNPVTFKTKTVFVGPWATGNYEWLNDGKIRAYAGSCTGCRLYCDIDINRHEPLVFTELENSEYCNAQIRPEYYGYK
jgi:hypothetical protein